MTRILLNVKLKIEVKQMSEQGERIVQLPQDDCENLREIIKKRDDITSEIMETMNRLNYLHSQGAVLNGRLWNEIYRLDTSIPSEKVCRFDEKRFQVIVSNKDNRPRSLGSLPFGILDPETLPPELREKLDQIIQQKFEEDTEE